jgi:hypothetical protein
MPLLDEEEARLERETPESKEFELEPRLRPGGAWMTNDEDVRYEFNNTKDQLREAVL